MTLRPQGSEMTRPTKTVGRTTRGRQGRTLKSKPGKARKSVPRAGSAVDAKSLARELNDALAREAATADVLKAISRSTFDLPSVLDILIKSAARLCKADRGSIMIPRGTTFHQAASFGQSPEFRSYLERHPIVLDRASIAGRVTLERDIVHVEDMLKDSDASMVQRGTQGEIRTGLGIPLLREGRSIGVIVLTRTRRLLFSDRQIELGKMFADQAVIAVENTRLLNELRLRTDDLAESLEQQTATSEVLKVISSSPGELGPVFQAMLENATRLCDARFGVVLQFDGEWFEWTADVGTPPAFTKFLKRQGRFKPEPGGLLDRVMRTGQVSHTVDYAAEGIPSPPVKFGGARSSVDVPMLKDGQLVGAFSIYRQEVRPFTEKEIALLTNFAAQAAIAIENARLLKELRERTDQLERQSREVANLNQQLERRVADQVGEIERMGRLRRFLPPQVADLIVASGDESQLESHRREITALFCDLRGFTGFSERSDPEDLMLLLREYHAAIGKIVVAYNGTVGHYAGDGVMVFFNDPIPIPNPALQAVLAALDMRAAIATLTEKWRRLGHELGFGVGIAHGFATLGTIGFDGRFDYAAIGTVCNVASRLCDEAKSGQILISPRVLMAVENAVNVEHVGDFSLKGISRPVAAYNLLSAIS
jgi:class 3 adenylate cyclase